MKKIIFDSSKIANKCLAIQSNARKIKLNLFNNHSLRTIIESQRALKEHSKLRFPTVI